MNRARHFGRIEDGRRENMTNQKILKLAMQQSAIDCNCSPKRSVCGRNEPMRREV